MTSLSRLLALALTLTLFVATTARAADRPNILMIAIDDQNDWIGCLGGHPLAKTPHIDALAKRGTVFLNAHCQSPLCNPSRTSLLIGRRPSTTGVYGLAPWFRDVEDLKDIVSLPQMLRKHGYKAYSTGKIYHGGYGRRKTDNEFDELGPPAGVGVRPQKPLVNTPSGHPLVDWGVFPHRDEDKGDWKVASWAVDELKNAPDEPFFLSVGFFLPHVPCYATQKWFDLYPNDKSVLPPILRTDRSDTPRFSWYLHWKLPEPRLKFLEEANQWENLCRSYLACTSFVDSQVGRVLQALDESGKRDNTIVVLWGDHGWHLGEKEITGKNTLWDDGTRVPLVFAGPGVSAGGRCTQPAELLDIYPTLLDLAGLPKDKGLEGLSLRPQLEDASTKRDVPAITTHNHDNHGVRSENWRYITYADGTQELYDMRMDPNEWKNLLADPQGAETYADVIAAHRKHLPKSSRKPVPGSAHRILLYENGKVNWEGEDVGSDDPIPEI
jgi:choline-sulfatase